MLEKLKTSSDKGMCTVILLTDLSNSFDCISHELLIANYNNNNNNIFPPKLEGLHLKMWTHICNVRFLNHCCSIADMFPMFV